ncbi:hypothetical protein [Bdellovibrio sp. BCCA]|uniref:hypothetical protein n=1 Tax=Bdellovibrio sp. BCCA TaxID=3136281 RepID=UPI0030F1A21D
MNKIILFLSVLMLSKFALATTTPAHVELCALEIAEEAEAQFTEETIFDIRKTKTISAFHLSLINNYIAGYNQEPNKNLTLADLQKMFGKDGEESFNDLYIVKYTSKTTGQVYLEVRTYPGDNPVGTVYNSKTGEILAQNSDDSYELTLPNGGTFSCYDLNKDKY